MPNNGQLEIAGLFPPQKVDPALAKLGLTADQVRAMTGASERDEITTTEAAEILGLSQRRIQEICDEGILLVEGRDWHKLPAVPGARSGGHFRIRRAAVVALRGSSELPQQP